MSLRNAWGEMWDDIFPAGSYMSCEIAGGKHDWQEYHYTKRGFLGLSIIPHHNCVRDCKDCGEQEYIHD